MPYINYTHNLLGRLLYLCHVCKGEVSRWALLIVLDNFKELCLPLQSNFELGVSANIVVERKGQDESLCTGVVFIWEKQDIQCSGELETAYLCLICKRLRS